MTQEIKKKIMIIEDDSFVLDIYMTKLGQAGFSIMTATNGVEAIRKLEDKSQLPDLILLDIIMPYINGLEVLKKISENDDLKKIPVILLTNLSQKEEVDEGVRLGAKDYLIKSHFTPAEVLEKITKYIN